MKILTDSIALPSIALCLYAEKRVHKYDNLVFKTEFEDSMN